MLKKILNNKVRVLIFVILVVLLALIRDFETILFYDPFLAFFKSEFNALPLPNFNALHLFVSLSFRYFLNAVVSLGIIYSVFKQKELVAFSALLYLAFFVLLTLALFGVLYFSSQNVLAIFYIRRFLIQPLFVILFVPAFYYQSRMDKKKNN